MTKKSPPVGGLFDLITGLVYFRPVATFSWRGGLAAFFVLAAAAGFSFRSGLFWPFLGSCFCLFGPFLRWSGLCSSRRCPSISARSRRTEDGHLGGARRS
jgi:hypothetical protein